MADWWNAFCRATFVFKTAAITACAFLLSIVSVAILAAIWSAEAPTPAITDADITCLCGWAGPEVAREAYTELKGRFVPFRLSRAEGPAGEDNRRVVLWDNVKAVLGRHTENYAQQVGDCVSFGTKNAIEYLLCVEISRHLAGEGPPPPIDFHPIFPPYIYGISRVQIGGGRIGGDGSVGAWAAAGVSDPRYGVLPADEPGVPKYSGSLARVWGRRPGPPAQFIGIAKANLIKDVAKVTSFADAKAAIQNGYPVTVASNRGFRMAGHVRSGKLWGIPSGSWAHQMCFVGYDSDPEEALYCLNSWGPGAHGTPPDDAPPGGFWVQAKVADSMLKAEDSFAYSGPKGFVAREVDIDRLRRLHPLKEDFRLRAPRR